MTPLFTIPQEMFFVSLTLLLFAAIVSDFRHAKIFRAYRNTPNPWKELSKDMRLFFFLLITFFTWAQNKEGMQSGGGGWLSGATLEAVESGYYDSIPDEETGISWALRTANPPFASNAVLTAAQFTGGFACVCVTNIQASALAAPSNAVTFADWPYAVARHAALLPPGSLPDGFTFGGRAVTNLYMAASGMLSFDAPKSSPTPATNGIPDGTALNYLAVFQTPSDIVPTNGLFWYAAGTNSSLFTWKDVFLGQDTNCLATVQAELYANGDFTCRYLFPSATNSYAALSNAFLIGAQNNPGGETVLLTNNLLAVHSSFFPSFELRWKSLAGLNAYAADHDDDGLATADELFIHHTDPRLKDSDGDGLDDPAEISGGKNPLNPDENSDGIPDGTDLTGYSLADSNLVFKLINNIAPESDPLLDSDGDGWADWLEARFGTDTNSVYSTPEGLDTLFSVTVSLAYAPAVPGVLAIGTNRVMVTGAGSWTFWRTSGEAHPVAFTAPRAVTAPFTFTLNRPDAVRYGKTSPDGKGGDFGKAALPLISFDPAMGHCCHIARTSEPCETYTAVIAPDLPGAFSWEGDGTWATNAPNAVTAGHDTTWLRLRFTPSGAAAYRENWAWVNTHCILAGAVTNNPDKAAVNNNDDDADEVRDDTDTEISTGDADLQPLWPLGRFDGLCCPCPEHQPAVTAATLVAVSQKLALYTDAYKTNSFGGTVRAGEAVHVEGLAPSTEPLAETLVWQWTENNETKSLTNALTVLSVRLFPDLDKDDDVDATDVAGFTSLSPLHGWLIPASTNILRKLRLRTDVGLSGGAYTLSLEGDAGSFKLWADRSGTNAAPLLACGREVTNGVNGVTFLAGDDTDLYVEAAGPGAAALVYVYAGTGGASNVSCSARLKMTAFQPDIDADSDNDGTIDTHDQGEDRYETYAPGMLLTVTNALAEGAGMRLPVRLSTDFMGFAGIARLEQISGGGAVRAWTNTQPGAASLDLPVEWDLTQNQTPPAFVWVDGVAEGGVTLRYSLIQESERVTSDSVRLTVIPPASYAPGRKDLVCIWAPLMTYSNANTNNNLGYTDAEKIVSELKNQGFTNVVWYKDVTGDTDLDLGFCTPENYLAMRNAGVFCVTASHGSPAFHGAVYAPYTEGGNQLIENWCSNKVGMICEVVDPVPGDPNNPGYYYASVSSEWMRTNWKPWLDTNKAITVWSICYSGTAAGQYYSVKEGTGGRWRIGYTAPVSGLTSYFVNETFFQYMNGTKSNGLRRTAGKAWGGGSEYSNYNAKMDGNPWTTLCPAFIQGEPLYPYSLFPDPGSTASPGAGWGCVLTDTYLSDDASPSGTFEQPGASMITDVRWISAGTSGQRGLGFDYDKSSNSNIWLRIVPANFLSDGLGGGRPLVKRADEWDSSWLDIIF